jgi:hypothetical protein
MVYISFYAKWIHLYLSYHYKKIQNFVGDFGYHFGQEKGEAESAITIHMS